MAWKVACVMDERKRFVLKALDPNARMAELCREFGVSRKTGYKWIRRFKENGECGLEDLSRRPANSPSRTSAELVEAIVRLRLQHPTWGPKKVAEVLKRSPRRARVSAQSTIAKILSACGLVEPGRRRRRRGVGSGGSRVTPEVSVRPNRGRPVAGGF